MRSAVLLIQLSLWVAFSHAFFPWFPKYRCHKDDTCTSEKRASAAIDASDSPAAEKRTEPLTFPLGQKLPLRGLDNSDPDEVTREAHRLVRKYARLQRAPATPEEWDLAKRQKTVYRIIKPAETTHPNSAGVFQDGSDFSYFVQAKLGSQGKPYYMLIDTGAATSWVMGVDCKSAACDLHQSFGPDDSETYEANSEKFSVSYGSGSVKGTKVTDSISLAGIDLTLEFGVANETSDDFRHFPFDGILGLSPARGETDNFINEVKESGRFDNNIFCVFLSRSSDGPNTGEISFGACNPDKYTGDFTYTDVGSSNGDWAIELDGLSYDGKKAGVKGKLAYIDTGTSYVFGPRDDVEAFHKNIPGSSSSDGTTWKVPCDSNELVTYAFSGVSYNISSKDWRSQGDDGLCTSNIYGHEVVPGAWLLGDLFLKNVYAVFDADQKRIGFANRTPVPPGNGNGNGNGGDKPGSESTTPSGSSTSAGSSSPAAQSGSQSSSGASSVLTQPAPSMPTSAGGEAPDKSETKTTGSPPAAQTEETTSSGSQEGAKMASLAIFVFAAFMAV